MNGWKPPATMGAVLWMLLSVEPARMTALPFQTGVADATDTGAL